MTRTTCDCRTEKVHSTNTRRGQAGVDRRAGRRAAKAAKLLPPRTSSATRSPIPIRCNNSQIDWEAIRSRIGATCGRSGLSVAEAMDTAQRGMGLIGNARRN